MTTNFPSSSDPHVSIIILNYNGKKFLKNCFSSLSRMNYTDSFEVIMLDNDSADGSVDYVKKNFLWVKVISFDKNLGFGGGNNRGAIIARGKYLAFLNNDTIADENWLRNLMQQASHGHQILASKTIFLQNPKMIEYGGGWLLPNGRGISIQYHREDRYDYKLSETGYPCAAAMLIEKEIFQKLGGFDEDYFAALDDTDLGWRAWLAGYKVIHCPESKVLHWSGGTAGERRDSPMRILHGTKNAYMNIIKNMELRNVMVGLVLAVGYDFLEILELVRRKNSVSLKAKIIGILWVLEHIHSIFMKRTFVQKIRVISDKTLVKKGLLLNATQSVRQYCLFRFC
jgi:hypothetical protein